MIFKNLFNNTKSIPVHQDIVGGNNEITYSDVKLEKVNIKIRGNNNKIIIEDGCILGNINIHIEGDDHIIKIKRNVYFGRGVIWQDDNSTYFEIGEDTHIESADFAITELKSKIIIGSNCLFAYDIDVRTGDSHSILDNSTKQRINKAKDVIIKDRVWIAAHSIILKGCIIENDTVIGSGTVLTKGFGEGNIIIAGNPGKVIKRNITWTPERLP